MSSTKTFSEETPTPLTDDRSLTRADDFVQAVRFALAHDRAGQARRVAARGAAVFPGHPWLRKADRVLNPSRIVSKPASAPDRSREFAWLREHSVEYRGCWVALHGAELLASGTQLEDVLAEVRSRNLDVKPLVHHIE